MEKENKKRLVIIDAHALVHRAFHALPPLSSQEGELTNAVFGFTSILIKVINEMKPDYIVACFDLPKPTFRHEEFAEYKAHRPKTDEGLIPQFAKVKEVVRAFGIPIFEKEGFEADDLLGTIAKLSEKQNPEIENIILTGDLDTLQLVSDKTFVYTLKKGIKETTIYDKKAVFERYGLLPEQMTDFKGLKGDPSDNIPGVPGIGDKTASALLSEYKTLEGIYENISLIKESLRKKLEEFKDQAFFSKKLATIITNVGIKLDIKKAKFGDYKKEDVVGLFKKLNFFTLISRLNFQDKASVPEKVKNPISFKKEDVENIKNKDEIFIFLSGDDFLLYSEKEVLRVEPEKIKEILEDDSVKKTAYDFKNILSFLKKKNIFLKGLYFDIKIASYLLSPGLKNYDFKKILLQYLGEDISLEDLKKSAPAYLLSLKKNLLSELEKNELKNIFFNLEMPLIPILFQMEENGIFLDVKKLKKISENFKDKIGKLEKSIFSLAGEKFNIKSSQQLGVVLFENLKIQGEAKVKKTKKTGAYSTGEAELLKLKEKHKIVPEILKYRELTKLKSTYIDALPKLVGGDGKIHTSFNQTGTATGRLSSSDPNMQNIPQKGEFAKDIRDAFLASEGFSLVAFDYSQIELRIIASLSGDEKMIDIFKKGGDIHKATAAEINKIPESEVTKKQRYAAKALNFGIVFGMGIKAFAEAADIEMKEAKIFIEEYFKAFPKLKGFIEKTIKDAKKFGYVKIESGRKRWLPELKSPNWILRNTAERMAQNMPAQGLEADILKMAMINIDKNILKKEKNKDIKMILQVHDELIFEIKDSLINKYKDDIKKQMQEAYKLKVPVVVELSCGKTWGSLSKI